MRAPLSWLREFVPVEAEPDELAARLTLAGLSVEELVRTGESIEGVIVGEVRAKEPHPDSDKLMLVRAFDGTTERDIVCGTNNYEPGDRVPLALPGARLPGGIDIGERVVRGRRSEGMLCSSRELRISDDHSGIMILDADAPVGSDLVDALALDDVVLDIEVTGNRPDCLSILGIAREIAMLYDLPLRTPDVPALPAGGDPQASVRIEDTAGCRRYVATVIEGVAGGSSPWHLRRRLLACGMRPVSGIVDVTNYVMLELGQPLHAFDLATLRERTIVVRTPASGEDAMTTLDGQRRALAPSDVLICDAERPVAIAGVMGGADTEVSSTTTTILLESATFDPDRVAATVRRLGMRSEASVRFEHGVDPAVVGLAAARAASLITEITGARVVGPPVEAAAEAPAREAIRYRPARARALIGAQVGDEEGLDILRRVGCDVQAGHEEALVTPPTWRPDITIEENLVEEVARLYGYDRVPETLPGGARTGGLSAEQRRRRLVAALLRARGLSEAQTLSLLPPSLPDRLTLPADHPWRRVARLSNPLSAEESVLRPALLPGLMLAAQRNAARRSLPVALFEIGTVFRLDDASVVEMARVAWVLAGPAPTSWHAPERTLDFYDAKGVLEALLASLGIRDLSVEQARPAAPFHPGRHAVVAVGETVIGALGELHPAAADALSLPERVAVCELDLALLLRAPAGRAPGLIPRFPAVRRDVALVVGRDMAESEVKATLAAAAGDLLDDIELFDVYEGDRIPAGTKSLAYALTLRAGDRTLTDADADALVSAISEAASRAGWSLRD